MTQEDGESEARLGEEVAEADLEEEVFARCESAVGEEGRDCGGRESRT
jgi:hypothetical protein